MLDRRQFVTHAAAGLGAAMAAGHPLLEQLANVPASWPDPKHFNSDHEAYWGA